MIEDDDELVKSKSQIKREMQALRDLGKELVCLPVSVLKKIDLSEAVYEAIRLAQGLKREALRRQLQHIGKLLREEDEAAIRQALAQIAQPQRNEVRAFHEIERWRDKLISGDDQVINLLVEQFPTAERQQLRTLVRNARKESELDKPPKSSRLLFKYLKELQQS